MSEEQEQQASFSGWAKVEVMGHQSHTGYVKTEAYGAAVLFRIDTPGLPEREFTLVEPQYAGGLYCPAGTKVKRNAAPGVSVLVGAGSIYRIIPCSEPAAMRAIDADARSPLMVVEIPTRALSAGAGAAPNPAEDDDSLLNDEGDAVCADCGKDEDHCHCDDFV